MCAFGGSVMACAASYVALHHAFVVWCCISVCVCVHVMVLGYSCSGFTKDDQYMCL